MEPTPPGSPPISKTASRLVWAALLSVLAIVAAAGVASVLQRSSDSGELQVLGEIPDFSLTERGGRTVTLADLRGKIWVADFIFTRCGGICPLLTSRMAQLQKEIGLESAPDLRFVSFSVDPAYDTPAVLREYARSHGAPEQSWLFLTGERDQLHRVIKDGFRLSVAEKEGADADPNEMITHSDRFVLVDSAGRIRGYYHGTDEESVARLRADLGRLRKEEG